jgi:hypothetical protein
MTLRMRCSARTWCSICFSCLLFRLLLLLGWPVVPLLRGLPAWIFRPVLGPLLRLAVLRRLGRWLISPPVAWMAMNADLPWLACARGLRFCSSTRTLARLRAHLFSRQLIRILVVRHPALAEPSRRNSWGLLLYLLSADLVNTALSAFLAFCDWPVYGYYLTQPNPFHVSPLSDQVLGAVIMWVVGSFVFLAPATWITFRLLQAPPRTDPHCPRGVWTFLALHGVTAAPSQEALVASRLASAQANLKLVDQRRAELNQTRQRAEEARANQPRQIAIQRAGAVNRQAGAQVALAQVHQAALHQNSGAGRRDYRREDGRSWRASGRGPGDVRHHADPRHLRNRQFQGDADS